MTSSPILNNSIKTIACESLQSGVGRVVVASLQSCSCPVGHLLSCWVRRIFQAETDQSCFCIFFYSSPVAGWWTRRQGRDIPLSLGSPCSSQRIQAPASWKVKRECIYLHLRTLKLWAYKTHQRNNVKYHIWDNHAIAKMKGKTFSGMFCMVAKQKWNNDK